MTPGGSARHGRFPGLVRVLAKSVLTLLMRAVPTKRQAVIAGSPDFEENSLVMAVRLVETYPGPVVLLCQDPAASAGYVDTVARALGATTARPRLLQRRSPQAFWTFLRSHTVLYTHGLYFSPEPPGKRVHVNLWHGVGPKRNLGEQVIGAHQLVTNTRAWGLETIRELRMPVTTRLVVGNPRQDMLHASVHERAALARLGLAPDRPVVAWLPTFRMHRSGSGHAFLDGIDVAAQADDLVRGVAAVARQHGVQLVLKPHPRDAADWANLGIACVSSEHIWDSGLTLYQFLGMTDGLLSDYSSAWVDYLETRRPIGLLCQDLESYRSSRGFKPPYLSDVADALILKGRDDVRRFFVDVVSRTDRHVAAIESCMHSLDYIDVSDRSRRLAEHLSLVGA